MAHGGMWMRNEVARRISWTIRSHVYRDPGRRVADARAITGSGRSGTTWLQELACRSGRLRPVFEPFDSHRELLFRDMPQGRYIRPSVHEPNLEDRVRRVLSGQHRSAWTDQMCSPSRYRGRVVKDIRINLWAGWLVQHFPSVPVVHVIRHPLAVVSSSSALGWPPGQLGVLAAQQDLVSDHLSPYLDVLEGLESDREKAVAVWCIENLIAIRVLGPSHARLVLYDEAVSNENELKAFLEYFGVNSEQMVDPLSPSRMTRPSSPIRLGGHTAGLRRSAIDPSVAKEGMPVLSAFGFDRYFSEDGSFDPQALRAAWSNGGSDFR